MTVAVAWGLAIILHITKCMYSLKFSSQQEHTFGRNPGRHQAPGTRQTCRQADRHTDRHTGRQADRQAAGSRQHAARRQAAGSRQQAAGKQAGKQAGQGCGAVLWRRRLLERPLASTNAKRPELAERRALASSSSITLPPETWNLI